MFRTAFALFVSFSALIFPAALSAQTSSPRPWRVSLEAHRVTTCVSDRVGTVQTMSRGIDFIGGRLVNTYAFRNENLAFDCGPEGGFRGGLAFPLGNKTTLSLDVTGIRSGNDLVRRVSSSSSELSLVKVDAWGGAGPIPAPNQNEASGISPIEFSAEDLFTDFSVDAILRKEVFEKDGYRVAVGGGLTYTDRRYSLLLQEKMWAWIDLYDDGMIFFDNAITLDHWSKVESRAIGPRAVVGLEKTWKRFGAGAELTRALQRVSIKYCGLFVDVDDVTIHSFRGGTSTVVESYMYDGYASLGESRENPCDNSTKWLTSSTVRLNGNTRLGSFTLSLGAQLTQRQNVPLPARLHDPWTYTVPGAKAPDGMDWEKSNDNIVSTSMFVGVSRAFKSPF